MTGKEIFARVSPATRHESFAPLARELEAAWQIKASPTILNYGASEGVEITTESAEPKSFRVACRMDCANENDERSMRWAAERWLKDNARPR
jgi:hypothetical protein